MQFHKKFHKKYGKKSSFAFLKENKTSGYINTKDDFKVNAALKSYILLIL